MADQRDVNPDEMPWQVVLTVPMPTETTAKFLQDRLGDDFIEQGNGVTVKIERRLEVPDARTD